MNKDVTGTYIINNEFYLRAPVRESDYLPGVYCFRRRQKYPVCPYARPVNID